jgi:predicted methyltransferase
LQLPLLIKKRAISPAAYAAGLFIDRHFARTHGSDTGIIRITPSVGAIMKTKFALFSITFFLTACGQPASDPAPDITESAEPEVSIYAAAVENPSRPEADLARDAGRQPAEVLEFLGIGPGATVLEMFAGAGYYTELLAHVVGANGTVVAHVNQPILNFAGDDFKARHADNRLPNVDVLTAENNELTLVADQFDVITIILNYHDLYWVSADYGWAEIDVPKFLAEIHKGLKPGGTLGIVDHFAAAGSLHETGSTLHRIDRDIVITELESAGFVLDGESDVLRNMNDDHSKGVFDPEIRGKTDRFVLRFKKPE